MSKVDRYEINSAVQSCLVRCYAATEVLAALATSLQELRLQEGWTERDVHDVELAVLKVLNGIGYKSGQPADAVGRHSCDAHPTGLDAADVDDG
jgi:hypothetical protein